MVRAGNAPVLTSIYDRDHAPFRDRIAAVKNGEWQSNPQQFHDTCLRYRGHLPARLSDSLGETTDPVKRETRTSALH